VAVELSQRWIRRGLPEEAPASAAGPSLSFLLDTNVVSELRKGPNTHPSVLAWFAPIASDDLWLSVLVVGEIRRGIETIRRRAPRHAGVLEHWLARLLRDHDERVLSIDRAVAEAWGRLDARRTTSVIDGLLAATALVHGLTLVTRNVRDVEWTGVPCLNPFERQGPS
jgi:hypothetical protein